jgi:uncharacterized protein YodC (DUF2158 family)
MANAFKAGDMVQLKSGGPPMTVDGVPGDRKSTYSPDKRDDYLCIWFKGASREQGPFAEYLLPTYTPPQP